MKTFRNILMTIGGIALVVFIILLIMGIKVVSTLFMYIVGAIVAVSLIGIIIYYVGRSSGKRSTRD